MSEDIQTGQRRKWRWLSRAIRASTKTDGPYMLGAVIVKGGAMLAAEPNRFRNHRATSDTGWSVHAEAAALHAASRSHLAGATLYVARITPAGRVGMAKPCAECEAAAAAAGITKVVYTTTDGGNATMRPQMSSTAH